VTRKPTTRLLGAQFDGNGGLDAKVKHFDQHGRSQDRGGRPRRFDRATEQLLCEKFYIDALAWEKQWGERLKANSKQVKVMITKLAFEEGVSASFSVLRDRIVYPVLRTLHPRESH
jgi:hypothetical protein